MKQVAIAAVQFSTQAQAGTPEAHPCVVRETRKVLRGLRGYGLDLVVLSEAVQDFGQTLAQAEAVDQPGAFLGLYAEFAAAERCHVAGPVKLRGERGVHNSIAYVGRDGRVLGAYHKTFLTQGEREMGLVPGRGAVVVDTDIGRLGGIICFDLNYEALRQQYRELKPDILTFASEYHGGLMQAMWAYDCRAFFVSALQFSGCGILDPFGRPLRLTDCYTTVARATVNLDRAMVHLDFNREKFPRIEKKYLGDVIIDVPPNIAPALVYSTTDKRTAMDIVAEFGLELLDDYFRRSIKENAEVRGTGALEATEA